MIAVSSPGLNEFYFGKLGGGEYVDDWVVDGFKNILRTEIDRQNVGIFYV